MFRAEAQFALNLSSSGAKINETSNQKPRAGAGEGNRTLIFSLEGCCSTIELHPPLAIWLNHPAQLGTQPVSGGFGWWRELDSNQRRHSQRVYSPPPLATRASLRPKTEPTKPLAKQGQTAGSIEKIIS